MFSPMEEYDLTFRQGAYTTNTDMGFARCNRPSPPIWNEKVRNDDFCGNASLRPIMSEKGGGPGRSLAGILAKALIL